MKKFYNLAALLVLVFSLSVTVETFASPANNNDNRTSHAHYKKGKKNQKSGKGIFSIFSKKIVCPAYHS